MSARALTRRFGGVRAASEVSFEVRRGEMFGLIGPDGAGKTTTLRMILGLLTAGLRPGDDLRPRPRARAAEALVAGRLPLAEVLALRRPHAWTRTSPSSPTIHDVHGLRRPARRAPRDGAHDALPRPPGRPPLRRHEAEARPRVHPRPHAGAAGPRRADHRRRPGLAPRLLEAPGAPAARRPDPAPDHPLPRRGRALHPRRAHRPGPRPDRRQPRRAARGRAGGDGRGGGRPAARGRLRRSGRPRASPRSRSSASGCT